MSLQKHISAWLLALSTVFCYAQQTTNNLLGPASGAANVAGFGNISWSVGEVVVFDQQTTPSTFFIAQGMQSYADVAINCPIVTVTSNLLPLCGLTTAFQKTLSFNAVFPVDSVAPDSLQWYFSDSPGTSSSVLTAFSKIAGASSVAQTSYQPYFPGYYAVCLTYADCKTCSTPMAVAKAGSEVINPPTIVASGSPPTSLTATPFTGNGFLNPSLQWYVYVESVQQYLLIAGGSNSVQDVRYDGDYMVVATYNGGCRLSSIYTVSGYNMPIQRATDVKIVGNTIYIPEEGAFETSSLNVYPNPATSFFNVYFQSSTEITSNVGLYSSTGTLIKEITFTEGTTWSRTAKVSTEDMSDGMYFVKVDQDKNLVQKVIVYK